MSDHEVQSDIDSVSVASSIPSTDNTTDKSRPMKRKRNQERDGKRDKQNSQDEILEIIGQQIKKQAENQTSLDRYDHFGSNIAAKLRDLKNDAQRSIAEKLISEVMFHAEFDQLHQLSSIQLKQPNQWSYGMQPIHYSTSTKEPQPHSSQLGSFYSNIDPNSL